MRYIKNKELYDRHAWTKQICEDLNLSNYTIRRDGTVDVDGDVMILKQLQRLPINFNKVSGDFTISRNKLTTLKGCPNEICGHFTCNENELISLEHSPQIIGGNYHCSYNKLTSLKGIPKEVNNLSCYLNEITTLEDSPIVRGNFFCNGNKISSLDHCKQVGGSLNFYDNPIYYIIKPFVDSRYHNKHNEYIELFNDTDIIRSDEIILDRLKWFYDEIGMVYNLETKYIKKYYKIIH